MAFHVAVAIRPECFHRAIVNAFEQQDLDLGFVERGFHGGAYANLNGSL
jgi:hypothetical protein